MEFERNQRLSAETATVNRLLGPANVAKWLGVSSGWVRDHAEKRTAPAGGQSRETAAL